MNWRCLLSINSCDQETAQWAAFLCGKFGHQCLQKYKKHFKCNLYVKLKVQIFQPQLMILILKQLLISVYYAISSLWE